MDSRNIKLLGIETSCDDTSICLMEANPDDLAQKPKILAFKSFNQDTVLKKWGGIVPEIAARNHMMKLGPLLEEIFDLGNCSPTDISAIGVTTHPGLLGPLLTGLNGAKTLALLHELPIIPVNHLFAHLEAVHLTQEVEYPYLGLLVSGGHSIYMLVRSQYDFEVLGSTIDDAAGEAFDKGGKLMGLGYPAGRIIDDLAKEGDVKAVDFPIGLRSSKDCNLSYSGLKTALRLELEKRGHKPEGQELNDLCASYQSAIVQALSLKLRYALESAKEKLGVDHIKVVVGGGVAANSHLRNVLMKKYGDVVFVEPRFCTDNGAMIANYALRTMKENLVPFPDSLYLDARGRFISKAEHTKKVRGKSK